MHLTTARLFDVKTKHLFRNATLIITKLYAQMRQKTYLKLNMQHIALIRTENGESNPGEIGRGMFRKDLLFYSRFMQK